MFINMDAAVINCVQIEKRAERVREIRETISKKYDRVSRAVSCRFREMSPRIGDRG